MMKLFQWLKTVNQNARLRGKMILTARGLLNDVEAWQPANISNEAVAVLLMRIGLFHLQAAYQEQLTAQNLIRSRQAHLN